MALIMYRLILWGLVEEGWFGVTQWAMAGWLGNKCRKQGRKAKAVCWLMIMEVVGWFTACDHGHGVFCAIKNVFGVEGFWDD